MSEDDQLNNGHKVLLWRRAILDLQKAEAQYSEKPLPYQAKSVGQRGGAKVLQ